MKTCSKCAENLPAEAFYVDPAKRGGLSSRCRECTKAASRKYVKEHYDEVRQRCRAYWKRNRSKWSEATQRRRAEVIAAYGGKCACCGESEPDFLAIDHVNNDGANERRRYSGASSIGAFLKRNGYPKGNHQLLCHNCNWGKYRGGGVCPHQRRALRLA